LPHAAQADVQQKAQMISKLQDLCRKLQAQNKEVKEEDILKRKQLINNFQNTLDDIKSRCSALCMTQTDTFWCNS
jgi:hypothetical protein